MRLLQKLFNVVIFGGGFDPLDARVDIGRFPFTICHRECFAVLTRTVRPGKSRILRPSGAPKFLRRIQRHIAAINVLYAYLEERTDFVVFASVHRRTQSLVRRGRCLQRIRAQRKQGHYADCLRSHPTHQCYFSVLVTLPPVALSRALRVVSSMDLRLAGRDCRNTTTGSWLIVVAFTKTMFSSAVNCDS